MVIDKYIVIRTVDGRKVEVPTVTFLATDVFALVALDAYNDIVSRLHPNDDYSNEISDLHSEFFLWRTEHPDEVKIPERSR